jgi:DNA-directed RNA polymerase specialized sigma24 family protein
MNKEVENYLTKHYYELLNISKKLTKGHELSQELLHEVVIQLYDKKEIKLKSYCDNSIKYYITAILRTNFYSKTSPFFYNIRKESQTYLELFDEYNYQTIPDIPFEEEEIALEKENIMCILEQSYVELEWWQRSLFDLYIVLGSIKKVSKKTRIPVSSVSRHIREIRTKIKLSVINKLD